MTRVDLIELCKKSIQLGTNLNITPILTLTIPAGSPKSSYRQPFGPRGPKARIVQWGIPEGRDVIVFNSVELLSFLETCDREEKG